VKVLFQDSIRVLDGHLVSRKRNHPSAEIEVQLVQRRAPESFARNNFAHVRTHAARAGPLAHDAEDTSAVRIKRFSSIATEYMRGTFDPTTMVDLCGAPSVMVPESVIPSADA
jgi:hypothetical protein